MMRAGIRFLTGLLNNEIDVLVSLLCFKLPSRRTRSTVPFYVPYYTTTNFMASETLR